MEAKDPGGEAWRSYATICRLCLQKDGFMLGIFNNIQGKEKSISKKIVDCTALPVHQGDGLPNVICHRCLFKIEFCLEFRQLCFLSDATLRQLHRPTDSNQKQNESESIPQAPIPLYEQLIDGGDENVVMVVDPNQMDYESDNESENERVSDQEARELEDDLNDVTDIRDDANAGKGVSLCRFCDHAFTDYLECMNHESIAHNTDQPYSCVSCTMDFADRMLYSAHMKSVHKNDKPYNCPQCARTFARRSDLRKHTVVHTGVKPFTCSVCLKSFSRNTNLSKHMRIHSGSKPFVCQKCPRTFTSKGDLNRHAMIHSGQKPFRCTFCNLSFGRKDKMVRHEKRHLLQRQIFHEKKQSVNPPENVGETGETNNFKENDVEIQNGERNEENMVINLDPFNHEVASGSEPNLQKNTDFEDIDKLDIEDHYLKDEQSGNEEDSDDHLETTPNGKEKLELDDDDESLQCAQCPKRFSTAEYLNLHVQAKHTGVADGPRPFNCNYCTKSFIRKRELERHLTVHTGIKPFKCPKCLKGFGRKDKLVRHIRIHDRPSFSLKKSGFPGFSSPERKRPLCLTLDT